MIITDPNQPDNPIVFANDAFSKLTDFKRTDVIGRNCRFLQGPETDTVAVQHLRKALEANAPVELELLNYKRDGSTFWNRLLVSPVYDDEGNLTYFFASLVDLTVERDRLMRMQRDRSDLEAEVSQRSFDLERIENRLQFALQAARLGSWSLDLATDVMTVTDGSKLIFGRSLSEPFTHEDIKSAVHPDDREMRAAALAKAIAETDDYNVEYRIVTPAGELRWLYVRGQVFRRADGTPLSLLGISQDITERKQSEEHRELLASELGHRVRTLSQPCRQSFHRRCGTPALSNRPARHLPRVFSPWVLQTTFLSRSGGGVLQSPSLSEVLLVHSTEMERAFS